MSEPIYLTPDELVERFQNRVTKKTLSNWRVTGAGPEFARYGNKILYLLSKVEEWEASRHYRSSGEHKAQRQAKKVEASAPEEMSKAAPKTTKSAATASARPSISDRGEGRPVGSLDIPVLHGACQRCAAGADYTAFDGVRHVGTDSTDGRYADVGILKCRTCGALWVRYHVEYEDRTGSGRWARGLIDEATAGTIEPADVVAHLQALPSYAFGGSYFGHAGAVRSGRMNWG